MRTPKIKGAKPPEVPCEVRARATNQDTRGKIDTTFPEMLKLPMSENIPAFFDPGKKK